MSENSSINVGPPIPPLSTGTVGSSSSNAIPSAATEVSVDSSATSAVLDDIEKVISISLRTDLYFNSGIRDFAVGFIQNLTGLSEKWAYRFQSIVDELCNNAIEHGSADGDSISVSFAFTTTYVKVWVEDNGSGADSITATDLSKRLEELRVQNADPTQNFALRGRGIVKIIESWTDEFTYEDRPEGGLKVTALKHLANAHSEDVELNAVEGVTFG